MCLYYEFMMFTLKLWWFSRTTYKTVQSLSFLPQLHFPIGGVKLIFTGGHISHTVAFKGLNVILGLYKCNYSLTRGKELYIRPSEGNRKADVAPW